ncbi:MAG: hypothetical protein ACLU4N_20940 [Butyricimonas faecihominis]
MDPIFPEGIMIFNRSAHLERAASREVAPGVRISLALTVEVARSFRFGDDLVAVHDHVFHFETSVSKTIVYESSRDRGVTGLFAHVTRDEYRVFSFRNPDRELSVFV